MKPFADQVKKINQVFTFNEASSGEILVEEVYQISETSGIIRQALYFSSPLIKVITRQPFGSWNSDEKLKTSKVTHWERRKDLRGYKFRLGTK